MMAKREKRRPNLPPATPKQVRQPGRSANGEKPLWAFRDIDLRGPWCWSKLGGEELADLLSHLKNFEGMTWQQIIQAGSHAVDVADLEKAARDRLVDIKRDDAPELFSLRVTGKKRAWGTRLENVLRFLWWDPEHEVCPCPLKYT